MTSMFRGVRRAASQFRAVLPAASLLVAASAAPLPALAESAAAAETTAAAETAAAAETTATAWTVDHEASRLGFRATQTGEEFTGEFTAWTADIRFDPDNLAGSRIAVSVDLASAVTGDRQRDKALPGKDWFDVKTRPMATFTAATIRAADVNDGANDDADEAGYVAEGVLSLRAGEKPLALPFTVAIDGDAAAAAGAVSLVRTDYGVGQGAFETDEWVGFDVIVEIAISATK